MSSRDKLIIKLKSKPKDLTWSELTDLLSKLDFIELSKSKTGDSRRKFYHSRKDLIINLHKPHPSPVLKAYVIKQVIEKLEEEKLI